MKERTARGTAIVNLLPLAPNEMIQAIIGTRDFPADNYLVFSTKLGQIKKTAFSEYDKSRREGFIAINLRDGDELVRVVETHGDDDVFMVTQSGMTIRFSEQDVRAMGRDAAGVRGVRLKAEDEVVSCDVARDEADILHRHRRRLRQADQGRAVQPPGPRRPGGAGDPADGQARPGGGRLHGRARGRDPARLDVGRGHPHGGARDRLARAGTPPGCGS